MGDFYVLKVNYELQVGSLANFIKLKLEGTFDTEQKAQVVANLKNAAMSKHRRCECAFMVGWSETEADASGIVI